LGEGERWTRGIVVDAAISNSLRPAVDVLALAAREVRPF
jgi:hypothetical protein